MSKPFAPRVRVSTYISTWMPTRVGVAGYFAGGLSVGVKLTEINKFAFLSETSSNSSTNLTTGRSYAAGFANSSVAGYVAGGENASSTYLSSIEKIAFPDDTQSVLSATLTTSVFACTGMANSNVAGYVGSGYDTGGLTRIDKIVFSNDAKSTLSATLTTARYLTNAVANSNLACYVGGGENSSGTTLSTIEKITLPYDTVSVLSVTLSRGNLGMAPFSNQGTLNA